MIDLNSRTRVSLAELKDFLAKDDERRKQAAH